MAIKILKKKNYLMMIENSAKGENRMFRNLYIEDNGREKDILENGGLSCAAFASSVLYLNKLIKDIHTTVSGTEKDMLSSGWYEIAEPRVGAVLVWEGKLGRDDNKMHMHIGFLLARMRL